MRVKILYVITSTGIGGAEKQLFELVTRLDVERFEPMVCSLKPSGPVGEALQARGIPFFSLDMPDAGGLRGMAVTMRSVYRLLMLVAALSPDILHTFLFRANQIGRFVALVQGTPVICAVRTQEMEKQFHHTCDSKTSFMVDHYTANSEGVREFTITKSRLKPENITTIANGIDMEPFRGSRCDSELKKSLGLAPEHRVITAVGRLRKEKGYPFLLTAFKGVVEEWPDTRLLIAGEGEEEASLKQHARELGIAEKIVFAGLRTDIPAILALSEIFVLSSLWEGMPNAVLEAMAAGRPVVATRVGGVPELVVEGETGLTVPPSDAAALRQALLSMLKDSERARLMGEKGRERAEKHFDIRLTVRKTEELYMKVLEGRGNS